MPVENVESNEAVLFFGCSYTFGDGFEDSESMPYQFQKFVGGRYQAFNYGYTAYGAHQMLPILENEKEKSGLGSNVPKYAFYQAITDHAFRGAFTSNENLGPKYSLTISSVILRVL